MTPMHFDDRLPEMIGLALLALALLAAKLVFEALRHFAVADVIHARPH